MENNPSEIVEFSQNLEKPNFILPRTEETINSIIADITKLFDKIRIYASVVYLIYLGLRLALFSVSKILDIAYISICLIQFVFFVLKIFQKIKMPLAPKIIRFIKLVPSLGMFALVCTDIFLDLSRVYPWQVVLTVFMGIGWILLLLGDLFIEFVPKYTERILTSFKQDIEVKDLVSRSVHQIADTAKDAIKSEEGKKVLKTGGAIITTAIIGNAIKTIINRRLKK